mmetsp:Transcript_5195/g.22057  ORF Transcript_5195/g.22057 Transcript_5195/m.22057 type:complete len:201 (-) Transcript_5195:110-712(-)
MSATAPEAARSSATNAASATGWHSSASVKSSSSSRSEPFSAEISLAPALRRRSSSVSSGDSRVDPLGVPSRLAALPRRKLAPRPKRRDLDDASGARAKVGSPAESVAESVNARLGSAGSLTRARPSRRAASASASRPPPRGPRKNRLSGTNRDPRDPRSPEPISRSLVSISSFNRVSSLSEDTLAAIAFHRAAPPSNSFS